MNQVIEYSDPPWAPSPTRFKTFDLYGEWRVAREAVRLCLASRELTRLPRGDNASVLLIPGWKAPEASMAPLRLFLKSRGFDANHWGLGTNRGDPERDSEVFATKVTELARQALSCILKPWLNQYSAGLTHKLRLYLTASSLRASK